MKLISKKNLETDIEEHIIYDDGSNNLLKLSIQVLEQNNSEYALNLNILSLDTQQENTAFVNEIITINDIIIGEEISGIVLDFIVMHDSFGFFGEYPLIDEINIYDFEGKKILEDLTISIIIDKEDSRNKRKKRKKSAQTKIVRSPKLIYGESPKDK